MLAADSQPQTHGELVTTFFSTRGSICKGVVRCRIRPRVKQYKAGRPCSLALTRSQLTPLPTMLVTAKSKDKLGSIQLVYRSLWEMDSG